MLVTGARLLVTTWRLSTVGVVTASWVFRRHYSSEELCAAQALCLELVPNSCLQGKGSTRYSLFQWGRAGLSPDCLI
jgi:hypothetical protein